MNKRKARKFYRQLRKALAKEFGARQHYSRSEISNACEEIGLSAADDLLLAWVLFSPASVIEDLAGELQSQGGLAALQDDAGQILEPGDFDWFSDDELI